MSIKIISGKYKGRIIDAPIAARPTLSRYRQSLFDALESLQQDRGSESFFKNKIILDCFAGSGSLGIESLSRGAQHVYFVDNNKDTISTLHSNLSKLKIKDSGIIFFSDINKIKNNTGCKCDIIFLDPPYFDSEKLITKTITYLHKTNWISEKSILVIETSSKYNVFSDNFEILSSRKIGNSLFTIVKCFK